AGPRVQRGRAGRNAGLRPGGARAAREEVHEDHFARPGSSVMKKTRLKRDDLVIVIAGKDRGKQGKVLRVIPTKGRVIVERVNLIKRHTRPNPAKNIAGGISEREAAIAISNVM